MSASPTGAPTMEIHLKKNFQYKTRGTIYSIPSPKPGSAKTGSGEGLILREDQNSWMLAKKRSDDKKERDERKMLNGSLARGGEGGAVMGSWMDPDWIPEIISVGAGGKGRTTGRSDMPTIGYGRKNPNERKRKK
jgi:RNA-binding protein NOB1